jgi:uncharacterized membrane protein
MENQYEEEFKMNKNSRLLAVLSYFSWVGFVISFILREKDDTLVAKHLNQALLLNIVSTFASLLMRWGSIFASVGSIINLGCFILFIIGVCRAFKMSEEPLPILGEFNIIS